MHPETEHSTSAMVNENGGLDGSISERDWTGYYTISLLVLKTRIEAAKAALPKGLRLDESYGSAGMYPILASFGIVEDARPRIGGKIGFNYYEAFSAIPGVQIEQEHKGPIGPYLYPYRGYLNSLVPVVLGRLGGFRKDWECVTYTQAKGDKRSYQFAVKGLFSGKPILEGEYEADAEMGFAGSNPRVQRMEALLPPNVVGVNPLGKLVRNVFRFDFATGFAWNLSKAVMQIHVEDFIPGIESPIVVNYDKNADAVNTVLWSKNNEFLPVRAFVPWRLISEKELDALAWSTLGPSTPDPTKPQRQAAAAGASTQPPDAPKPGA